MTLRFALPLLIVLVAACSEAPGPPIAVTNVVVTSPGAAMPMAAGYMKIGNRSGAPIRITAVTSPNYESVEMHETTVEDGVARMRELPELVIHDGETVTFERGGKHLMLMRPVGEPDTVTLNFYSEDVLLVTVSTKFAPTGQ
jgi:copper(I)-binding protein